ncbi:hypothetical protein LTY59_09980 [Limosilactobacillus balticus]|uniref:Uncharacterized protein n=1 Tax=Limosilactobacillus balticus TaxID=2759747 RepID=A0ABS8RFQ7_9LACO|nr:hypothetical protein [Limosilactobacillus balticus]MCD7139527.1 hypothetical protein [Limosilactobacillus balticus]
MATLKFKNGEFYVGKEEIDGIYAFNINEDFEKQHNPDLYNHQSQGSRYRLQ